MVFFISKLLDIMEAFFPRSKGHGFESQTSSSAMLLEKMTKAFLANPVKILYSSEDSGGLLKLGPWWVVARLILVVSTRRCVGFLQLTSELFPWANIVVSGQVAVCSTIPLYVLYQWLIPCPPNWLRKSDMERRRTSQRYSFSFLEYLGSLGSKKSHFLGEEIKGSRVVMYYQDRGTRYFSGVSE